MVRKLIGIPLSYKTLPNNIKILEPSFGTGNFITELKEVGFTKVDGCEIDPALTDSPKDFFELSLSQKYDLIIGNPPFTKYNVIDSYYHTSRYMNSAIPNSEYLPKSVSKKDKEKIENAFILKSLKHLKDADSILAFVLPISFFIKNRNTEIKKEILKKFSTVVIYQNSEIWFNYDIPCCFAVFMNALNYKNNIILIYEDGVPKQITQLPLSEINSELIPKTYFNIEKLKANFSSGPELSNFLLPLKRDEYLSSFTNNNISAKNILTKTTISDGSIEDYKMAIVRVGNSSVGKCGLIDVKRDILNDMFYVFDFKPELNRNKEFKEKLCSHLNKHQDYFKSITCRVGSKSLKRENIFNLRVDGFQSPEIINVVKPVQQRIVSFA